MNALRARTRAPGNLTAVFLAVAGVSVFALIWLAVAIVRQDRALEVQRLGERREAAADRMVTALEREISADERQLDSTAAPLDVSDRHGAILVVADSSGLQARPEGHLLFYPSVAPLREAPADAFREAETLEYADRDSERAIAALRQLSTSRDPAVKAGALLRLARNLRKTGRAEAALEVYTNLASVTGVGLSGVAADLVARRAGCALLQELGRKEQLRKEAQALAEDLRNGRWQLDRAAWQHYTGQVREWLGANPGDDGERLALAEAVDWMWQRWRSGQAVEPRSSGRHALEIDGAPATILWRASNDRLMALVAGAQYQQRQWFEPALAALDRPGIGMTLLGEKDRVTLGAAPTAGSPESRRLASATGLPWTIVAWSADVEGDLRGSLQRRRLIVVGLGALCLLVVAASYLIGRGVSRELAAARLQSDFVSAVSHEFRTPLTSLAEFTEILTEHEDAPVDAAQLAGNVVRDFRQEVEVNGFTIDYAGPPGGAMVRADRDALAQALWNLLDNAVKYSGDSRTVRVEVEVDGEVAIRVGDSGYGIAPAEQKLIFRKFARGAAAIEHNVKGTGIGLAMVKHIVDAHGGSVTVASEPGRGSVFAILLPGRRNQESGTGNQGSTTASVPES